MKSRARSIALVVLHISVLATPRLPGINRFATIDEPYWLTAGSDFYYALGRRDFANTVYDYHPAVITMWIVMAAMLLYFPQYRGLVRDTSMSIRTAARAFSSRTAAHRWAC